MGEAAAREAVDPGHPQIGRAGVEDHGEGLRRRADVDVAKVLRVAKVVEGLVEEDRRRRVGERLVVVGDRRNVGLRRRGRARRREEGLHRQPKSQASDRRWQLGARPEHQPR
mgnify:CR=1 FL=1